MTLESAALLAPTYRALAAFALGAALIAGGAADGARDAQAQVGFTHTWVVKVDETTITRYDIEQRARLLRFEKPNLGSSAAKKQAREELIDEALQEQAIKRSNAAASDEDVKNQFANIAQAKSGSEAAFEKALQRAGASRSDLERRIRIQLGWSSILRRRHGEKIVPSEVEIEDRLAKGPTTPKGPTVYRIAQILVDVQKTAVPLEVAVAFQNAQKARQELKTGCKPDVVRSVAKKYSKVFPGRIGETTKDRMPEPLQKLIMPLKSGQTTEPLRTPNGYIVFQLCGVKSLGGKKLSADQIKQMLFTEKLEKASRVALNDMRRDALIEEAQ